jgi:hypothetical protein
MSEQNAQPRDERPRPQYGEYAPEGWTWKPPAGEHTSDPAPQMATPPPAAASSQTGGAGHTARRIDRTWTVALLVLGAIGAVYNSISLIVMPSSALESVRISAEMLGTTPPSSFTPGPGVPALIAVGVAAQLALWVGALLWSRARMRAGLSSWWIPLVAGVIAFIVVMVVGVFVLTSDPTLFEFLRSTSVPTPAP